MQGEDQVALRGANCYAARLVRQRSPELGGIAPRADGSYLITGGLGALGLAVARWLVRRGARHLVLTGRRGAPPEARGALEELERLGAAVTVARADVTSEQDMAKVLDDVATSGAPLRGVVHAAGLPGYQALVEQDLKTLRSVLGPKVVGTWVVHQLTRSLALDFFVGFSSIASVWGSKGQAHYAAANSFVDAVAHYRRRLGLPGTSVNWGPWASGGMATTEALGWLARMGVKSMAPDMVVEAMDRLIRSSQAQSTVADVDWSIFKELHQTRGRGALLDEIEVETPVDGAPRAEPSAIVERLEAAPEEERCDLLRGHVRTEVAAVLGFGPTQLPDLQQGFFEMGMDLLMAVDLKRRLESSLGCSLPSTLAFDFPTVERLSEHLSRDVFEWPPAASSDASISRIETRLHRALSDIAQLSDEEVEVSIEERLVRLQALTRESEQ